MNLKDQIETTREEMVRLGMEKGFDHQETIDKSQELDKLIIKEMKSRV
ncbi:Spo0E-like sporulation regulatory protein [Bacillus phage vB_BpsM-61]|nr:Spo0E-like sporulation regulatory protein [Bacillus phage vB_BpsM-61]